MSALPPAPTPHAPGRYRTDVLIVGAGVAGLYAARSLPDGYDVIVLDKGEAGRSGSSPWAQGGMAAAVGPDDSPALHAADTIRAGDGLCDPAAVGVLTAEAPATVRDLIDLGAVFDRRPDLPADADPVASLHLAREGGQSVGRSVHRADATGAELVRVLRQAVTDRVQRLEGIAVALAAAPHGPVGGCWVLDRAGQLVLVEARAVLLASGGCGALFAATTNQDHATGDGIALAHRAGAAVRDQEFVQFHPTGMAVTGTWRFLLTEALRGAGARLLDADGHRFMPAIHPDAELAPRHIVAKAILDQRDGAWLDATALGTDLLEHEFPTVLAGARRYGFDLATEPVPVTPAAHYMVGGVRTDLDGRTSLPGLYAAGEVASTGLHGANRMASNSLAEALVFGARSAAAMVADLPPAPAPCGDPPALIDGGDAADLGALRDRLQRAMWAGAGPVRDAASLARTRDELDALTDALGPAAADEDHIELTHALTTARLITAAAILRTESRGGHWRQDHPTADERWAGIHLERVATAEA